MAGPALFFVPLAIAGGKVFFKFATKKAAQAFKGRFAKAGSVTTRTPPKNATVTTTGSNKGKSIIKDMTEPVTQPRISPRNPNTSTLPKAPAKGSGGAKAAGAAATGAGVAAGSTATGKDADKTKSNRATSKGGRSRAQVVEERQKRLARQSAAQGGGSVLSNRKKKTTSGQMTDSQRKSQGAGVSAKKKMATPTPPPKRPKKKMTTPTPPPKRPKKSTKVTKSTSKPKMRTAINTRTGKPDWDAPKVTDAERLKQEDAYKQFRRLQTDIIKSKLSEAAKKSTKKKGKK